MQRGFSILELIVVLSIFVLIAALAVPCISDSIAVRELEDSAQQLAADIRWTQQSVVNADQKALPRIVFINSKPYGYRVTRGLSIIKRHHFANSVIMTGNPGEITFKINGLPVSGSDLTFWLKSSNIHESRKVIIARSTGRVRVEVIR